jgi:hypothetical protein
MKLYNHVHPSSYDATQGYQFITASNRLAPLGTRRRSSEEANHERNRSRGSD